tara:strand:- start:1047 stop:1322 length:276 start_codon:yes stop_codon:yes gene_type:complete
MDASLQDIAVSMGLTGVMLSMLLMGLLIAYYGSTKTRTAGFGFLAVGAALAYFTLMNFDDVHFGNAFISFLGGMIGGILGIIIFLVAIIKS